MEILKMEFMELDLNNEGGEARERASERERECVCVDLIFK